jgi:hypothetical protein
MVGAKQFAIGHKIIEATAINPLLKKIMLPAFMKSHEAAFKNLSGSFMDRLDAPKPRAPENKKTPSLMDAFKKDPKAISEEMVDYLTYKVLHNIKKYLQNETREKSTNKRIQISIDM